MGTSFIDTYTNKLINFHYFSNSYYVADISFYKCHQIHIDLIESVNVWKTCFHKESNWLLNGRWFCK